MLLGIDEDALFVLMGLRVHYVANQSEEGEFISIDEFVNLFADIVMPVLVEHCPGLEHHDSTTKFATDVTLLELVRFVVTSEISLDAKVQCNFLVKFVILHFIKIRFIECCVL